MLGANWFWLWLWFWFVSWPIGECTAWQEGSSCSLQFLEALSMALPLQLILAFWHLRFLFGGYQRRILLVLFVFFFFTPVSPGMLAPDKTFCILNLHWNFLTSQGTYSYAILYTIFCMCVCTISKVDLLITRNESQTGCLTTRRDIWEIYAVDKLMKRPTRYLIASSLCEDIRIHIHKSKCGKSQRFLFLFSCFSLAKCPRVARW